MNIKVSVVMPVYNVQRFVKSAIESVLNQSYDNFELILVNDCATDNSLAICQTIHDSRIRIINHKHNKGLAAARNTGIRHAIGHYVAFIDSDDQWHQDKLQLHVDHLNANPKVGISFSRSAFMQHDGTMTAIFQMPQLNNISAEVLLCRNPVGNGSAPVIRRAALNDIRFQSYSHASDHSCYFDETFRQSEDIECWLRMIATTKWQMAGIPQPLTYYRLNPEGLSSDVNKQLASWEKMIDKARIFAPKLLQQHESKARAYQLRYLARQAVRSGQGTTAKEMINKAIAQSPALLMEETGRTVVTFSAAYLLYVLPKSVFNTCAKIGQYCIGVRQRWVIGRDGVRASQY
ncbi:glycosyltransferase family 2 protein [Shewanella waksmanii]|uniref:glycosyltransferase family 2 protein n=1 Tax=Shewanella waksmanii TaxID=213783 RepID=UPI000491FAD4|nr:glycosyltransferase family 2 protein [Shewanella waksmanii]